MDILGIGPLELFFILIIALIVLGPNDMVKAGRTIGRFLRKVVTSPSWRVVQQTSRDIRYLPNKLIREAGLEELEELKEIKQSLPDANTIRDDLGLDNVQEEVRKLQDDISDWTTPPPTIASPTPPDSSDSPPSIDSDKLAEQN
jgi:Sec-independent protein translocase protein TatA